MKERFENEVLAPASRSDSSFGEQGTIVYFSMESLSEEEMGPMFVQTQLNW